MDGRRQVGEHAMIRIRARGLAWIYVACFGGAALFAVWLWLNWSRAEVPADAKTVVGLSAALLAVTGWCVVSLSRAMSARDEREAGLEARLRSELQTRREEIDCLAEGIEAALLVCDERGHVQYANAAASQALQFEEPVGHSVLEITLSYDLEKLVLDVASGRPATAVDARLSFPRERLVRAKAWKDPVGNRVFLSLQDVTEMRRLERVRQDFVANVSHELRTPLASIRALAETVADETKEGSDQRARLEQIVSEVDRLSQLTSDLLILSTAESAPIRHVSCDLARIVRGVVDQLRSKAESKGLELTYEGPKELELAGNPAHLTQVAINLIDNAIVYTLEGRVTVRVSKRDGSAWLEVQDTGIGIASEHLGRVFERFYRVDKGRSRAAGGTGLGLSIVKHIVEVHGGTVEVESELGVGSTFRVKLPLA
jgi:two-component system phosphate regulon sensor histidine kinase PhoR